MAVLVQMRVLQATRQTAVTSNGGAGADAGAEKSEGGNRSGWYLQNGGC